jgi:hypothetical protein
VRRLKVSKPEIALQKQLSYFGNGDTLNGLDHFVGQDSPAHEALAAVVENLNIGDNVLQPWA